MTLNTAFIVIETTFARRSEATQCAQVLLHRRDAACVQITQIESHYLWQGKLETQPEYRLSIKTHQARYEAIAAYLTANHSYHLPQIYAVPMCNITPAYAEWLREQCMD